MQKLMLAFLTVIFLYIVIEANAAPEKTPPLKAHLTAAYAFGNCKVEGFLLVFSDGDSGYLPFEYSPPNIIEMMYRDLALLDKSKIYNVITNINCPVAT